MVSSNTVTKIYEHTPLTVKARIDAQDAESIEEVTFKFLKDGEQFDEKTIPISQGARSEGQISVSHSVQAPAVPDDKDRYFLDYHYFYKVKNKGADSDTLQNFPSTRIQVFPRVAQLKVTDSDGNAFPGFQFRIEQDGERSDVQKTFTRNTTNARGETIPAGSGEFNLGLFPAFRIVPEAPYEISEEVVGTGRKREIKGTLSFRAVFLAPERGNRKQYVNEEVKNFGHDGSGHEVTIQVGIDPEDHNAVRDKDAAEVHFRITFGPAGTEANPKSARNDADHPTKALKVSDSDSTATIDEKEAGKKYEGKVTVKGGKFKVALGKAGGDTCRIEISGSKRFLTDTSVPADATLQLENWRRVYYELMLPDIMSERILASAAEGEPPALIPTLQQKLDSLSRRLFIEFVFDIAHVFNAFNDADYGALAPRSFLGEMHEDGGTVYVLSGRNWRKLPAKQMWKEAHPGNTLCLIACDLLLKWRKDTEDTKKATDDFSGTLTEAEGSIDIHGKFGGYFMPFSGYDADESITNIKWTADISKDDAVCKYKPQITIAVTRGGDAAYDELYIDITADDSRLPDIFEPLTFVRPPYPAYTIEDKTQPPASGASDDGKVTLKEPVLNKELTLSFDPGKTDVTPDHTSQIEAFFKGMFSDGKSQLTSGTDTNVFRIEVHGAIDESTYQRLEGVFIAVGTAYQNTFEHDIHSFSPQLSDAHVEDIQSFVTNLLLEPFPLVELAGKIAVHITCPESTNHGEDDCLNAVKSKLQEVFDATTIEFSFHPGLDQEGAAREGSFTLADITDVLQKDSESRKSTMAQWHFRLPNLLPDGQPGPGSFAGSDKTARTCPVKFECSIQTHEQSNGEIDGKWIAWVVDSQKGPNRLLQMILQSFKNIADNAALKPGHGDKGSPGDCLTDAGTACDDCIAFGRSMDLTRIG